MAITLETQGLIAIKREDSDNKWILVSKNPDIIKPFTWFGSFQSCYECELDVVTKLMENASYYEKYDMTYTIEDITIQGNPIINEMILELRHIERKFIKENLNEVIIQTYLDLFNARFGHLNYVIEVQDGTDHHYYTEYVPGFSFNGDRELDFTVMIED